MKHKGYAARIEYDESVEAFHGRILGIRDIITFEGQSVAALQEAFREAVDDYLDWCHEEGRTPEKPCSGKFNLRLDPELHRRLTVAAEAKGESLNTLVVECLEHALNR